jgi:hypothetical protein
MPKLYVLHCPVSCGHRRPVLEEHLKERGFTDVEWITDYAADHPYVKWMHKRLGSKGSPAHISGFVKGMEMFRLVARDKGPDKWFWKCDDDVVFIKNWNVPIPEQLIYVNMSVGVNFHILPDARPQYIGNNGGAEVMCFTRDFAQLFLDNIDTRQSSDIVIHGLLNYIKHPLVCIPVAQQTSLLEPKQSTLVVDETLTPWVEFVQKFKPTGIKYEDLRNESGFFARDDA